MIGQEKLKKSFSAFTLQTLPKAILLVGRSGCGKHLFASELAVRFKLGIVKVELTDDIDSKIAEYQSCPVDTLYEIDLSKIDLKSQNKFLKFIEEPAKNVFIVIFAEDTNMVLETVQNRCLTYRFEKYSMQELKDITKTGYEDYIYEICKTPGEVNKVNPDTIDKCKILCDTIVRRIHEASYANTISILNKLNFLDQYDKIDPILFYGLLKKISCEAYLSQTDKDKKIETAYAWTIYQTLLKFSELNTNGLLNKQWFIMALLSRLWENTR